MKKVGYFLFGVLLFFVFIAVVVSWFWGVPFIGVLIYDKLSYWFYATIWVSIHLVRNIIGRIVAQKQLKQFAEINKILGGK